MFYISFMTFLTDFRQNTETDPRKNITKSKVSNIAAANEEKKSLVKTRSAAPPPGNRYASS